jgi:hypothetical protein
MSPNSYVTFNAAGLLCAYAGEEEREDPAFTWTFSTFEEFLNESVTPSMYHAMAGYIASNITNEELRELARDDYAAGNLEASAVDAYFDLSLSERITAHEQELVNLRADIRKAADKESAAIDAMLEEYRPFDDTSPIATEYAEFMRGIITSSRAKINRLERELHEEEQWRGGHEEGQEDDSHLDVYDPMEY